MIIPTITLVLFLCTTRPVGLIRADIDSTIHVSVTGRVRMPLDSRFILVVYNNMFLYLVACDGVGPGLARRARRLKRPAIDAHGGIGPRVRGDGRISLQEIGPTTTTRGSSSGVRTGPDRAVGTVPRGVASRSVPRLVSGRSAGVDVEARVVEPRFPGVRQHNGALVRALGDPLTRPMRPTRSLLGVRQHDGDLVRALGDFLTGTMRSTRFLKGALRARSRATRAARCTLRARRSPTLVIEGNVPLTFLSDSVDSSDTVFVVGATPVGTPSYQWNGRDGEQDDEDYCPSVKSSFFIVGTIDILGIRIARGHPSSRR